MARREDWAGCGRVRVLREVRCSKGVGDTSDECVGAGEAGIALRVRALWENFELGTWWDRGGVGVGQREGKARWIGVSWVPSGAAARSGSVWQ